MLRNILVILAILVLLLELYRYLRKYWLHRLLEKKKAAKGPRKPPVLRPESEKDCPVCQQEKGKCFHPQRELPVAWKTRKGVGGRKKRISTAGYFCPNPKCVYYGIREEAMHALVGDGRHGK